MRSLRQMRREHMVVLVALAVGLTTAAQAKTTNVAAGQSIQAAINAAVAGDVVVVAAGTYKERLDFKGKAITVKSTNPTNKAVVAATIIDGDKKGSAVTFKTGESANAVLTGFTVTNGSGTVLTLGGHTAKAGGGILCLHASPSISNTTIRSNSADAGGGIFCHSNSSPIMTNNAVTSNSAAMVGGGVMCYDHSSPRLTNTTISGNSTAEGGGMFCDLSSSPTLTNSIISGNRSSGCGGGLACENSSSPNLINNTISGNSATDDGGALFCSKLASPTLTSNILSGNSAGHRGGGLYVDVGNSPPAPSKPVITYCDFYGNTGGNYVNWPDQTGKNGNISKNPIFANLAKGDFHEKSKGGRWNPATKSWVIDTVQSPCINKGNPTSAFALEPAPNGGRINMGAYGNTVYASKSAPPPAAGGLLVSAAVAPASGGGAQLSVNLSAAANVEVTLTNLAGRAVAALTASDLPAGVSTLLWSGKGSGGLRVPSGTYLARLLARSEDGSQCQTLATVCIQR